jgi:very-short-patch-repair endonuclease
MLDPDPTPRPRSGDDSTSLRIDVAGTFNYVAWQNSFPLLHSVTIENRGPDTIESATLELIASPAFARPRQWPIDRIRAGDPVSLRETDIDMDVDFLDKLDEAERAVLRFQLRNASGLLAEASHEVRVLSRDEWGGMGSMAELLPAFVTPNDPAIGPLLKSASSVLEEHGYRGALDGYQSHDPNRVFLLANAIWSAVTIRSLTYANPPGSFEQVGQKTRRIGVILQEGLATCLDTTLLFASALEAMGLNTVLVMKRDHCFVGVWLRKKIPRKLIEEDCSELRKAIVADELLVFETTLVTQRPPVPFDRAVTAAESALGESNEHDFVAAIDVARARMAGIRPLATRSERSTEPTAHVDSAKLPLSDAPGYAVEEFAEEDEASTTPTGRIDRWQRKLLDLSLRNRLLNYRESKQCIPIHGRDLARVEDCMAKQERLRLVSLLDENRLAGRDPGLHRERTQRDLDDEFADLALARGELACPLDAGELDVRLTGLLRKVKNDLAEGGTNTLFLALGFIRWRKCPTDAKTYRAPLLLIPVKLTRSNATAPFYLNSHEDEARFNATLAQLLKRDFDCDLGSLEANLPTDDNGLDVAAILERTRRAIRDLPGFEVVEEAAVAAFSFAKYLMWKDLVDRIDMLDQNRVVRHLVHDPDKPFRPEDAGPLPQPRDIDARYQPADIVHPLPADSSQLAAVMAASEGHDLVIVGPPGTGKSQTIANLIAQCLSTGRSVLFVAEKTAALDVVHRRLREHGLGDCAIELHSNKAERRRFLEQLEASWKRTADAGDGEWLEISERLRVRRDELNAYVAGLHAEHPNGWTIHRAMGLSVQGGDLACPTLGWGSTPSLAKALQHDRGHYKTLTQSIANAASARQALPTGVDLGRVEASEWSMAWETELLDNCRHLRDSADQLTLAAERLLSLLDAGPLVEITASQLAGMFQLAKELTAGDPPPSALLLHPDLERLKSAIDERGTMLAHRHQAVTASQNALSQLQASIGLAPAANATTTNAPAARTATTHEAADPESIGLQLAAAVNGSESAGVPLVFHRQLESLTSAGVVRAELMNRLQEARRALEARAYAASLLGHIPIDTILAAWMNASAAPWPLSLWKKYSVKQRLKTFMAPAATPDPAFDVPLLVACMDSEKRLDEHLRSLQLPAALETAWSESPAALDEPIAAARRLRGLIQQAGGSLPDSPADIDLMTKALTSSAASLLATRREIEALDGQLASQGELLELPPELRKLAAHDVGPITASIDAVRRWRSALAGAGFAPEQLPILLRGLVAATPETRTAVATGFHQLAKQFQGAWQTYTKVAGQTPAAKDSRQTLADARRQAETILSQRVALRPWTMWVAARQRAEELGLAGFAGAIWSGDLAPQDAGPRFELAYARWWLPQALDSSDPLRGFQRVRHEQAIEDFRRLDDLARKTAAPRALQAVHHGLPDMTLVPRASELGYLRHQLGLKRPSKSIRDVITNMPTSFRKLAPCLLMSPLSIAQYLPPGEALFDVVVFDEASQISTWDAIGAIARGKQTIIVGDPKQLPPTNFFGRADDDEANEDLADHEKDLESILDEVQASGMPTVQLNWHYRSRHESLIAFSNRSYYGGQLITFPAAESTDRGVSLTLVEGALYDRGNTRTNRLEAEAIVADAVRRMKQNLTLPEGERLTFGVVTFNSQQQTLIQDLFDEALRGAPELEWFFADERLEPTAVKNLENVQGDERDIMYFSITFGWDANGKFPVDFGAINRTGGERRLNVAVTRARQALCVYASFQPDQLQAARSTARGVNDLKRFLEFAQRGTSTLATREEFATNEHDCPLERSVAQSLTDRGWRVERRVGVSDFRVDLGIVHPDHPETFLAAVECDGATYLRSATARDRDKTRKLVLEGLGWNVLRVWSTHWSYDPRGAAEELHARLEQLLADSQSRSQHTPCAGGDNQAEQPARP